MIPRGVLRVSLTFSPKSLGKPLINFSFQNGELQSLICMTLVVKTSSYHRYVAKGFTSKVTQLVVNPRCNVAGFSYEVAGYTTIFSVLA